MRRLDSTWILGRVAIGGALLISAVLLTAPAQGEDRADHFESAIRPVLVEHCYQCHSAETTEGNLRLDNREGLRRGGDRGPALVPGNAETSLIVSAIAYQDDLQMPPDRKLPPDVIQAFTRWVNQGAYDPRSLPNRLPGAASPVTTVESASHLWSLQVPRPQLLPPVVDRSWPKRRHDFFVLNRIEAASITPNREAQRNELIQRLAFDLIGLPPTEEQRHTYNYTQDPRWLEQYVDELLASPHFGERWARLWLDLARYAEDQAHIVGNNEALFYPNAYLYRDWVISAFNRDLCYQNFVRCQLAADYSPSDTTELNALGFLGLGPKYYDRKRLEVKAEEWEDRVDTVCRTFLGLTVACARCHDHKYDPIPTRDYYSLASIFASTEMHNRPLHDGIEVSNEGQAKKPSESSHVVREGKATDLHVFVRGNVQNLGDQVHRGFLSALSNSNDMRFSNGSGRLELATAIADRQNPLTARVYVNRIWLALVGIPIVTTPSNFGALGARPSHPRLLDDLAIRFMDNGWSTKWLVREIVTSATYTQSSRPTPEQLPVDPDNRLLSRMVRKRLPVEAWRDRMLVASGNLDSSIGGKSIQPDDTTSTRRTVYARISRFQLNPMLATFDAPDANVHSARRVDTTTPQQRLLTINHPFMIHQARAVAARITSHPGSVTEKVRFAFRLVLGRLPANDEFNLATRYVNEHDNPEHSWLEFSHSLLASNEMLFLD